MTDKLQFPDGFLWVVRRLLTSVRELIIKMAVAWPRVWMVPIGPDRHAIITGQKKDV